MKAIIYSKTTCPYCVMTKQFLTEHGVSYEEVIFDDDARRQEMYDTLGLRSHQRTVPQIFFVEDAQQRWIGGYTDLLHSDVADRLAVGDLNHTDF